AAWWAAQALKPSHREHLAPGDAIALMNGHFFSTGRAVSAVLAATGAMSELISAVARHVDFPPETESSPSPAVERLREAAFGLRNAGGLRKGTTQLPVSLRDGRPALAAIGLAFGSVEAALASRLSGPSANPLFDHN